MRQIAVLPQDRAELLADYLLTQHIATQLERLEREVAVWVCDEDKVPQAKAELAAFTAEPTASRYTEARREAASLRQKDRQERGEDQDEEDAEAEDEKEGQRGPTGQAPLTLVLAMGCLV